MLPKRNKLITVSDALPLQWANGKAEIRRTPGQGRFVTGEVGWYAEAGKSAEFDGWATKHGLPTMEIRHPRPTGPAEVVTHWNLGERVGFIPISSGPVAESVPASLKGQAIRQTAQAGLGLRWPEGEKSKLAVRGYLVLDVGQRRQVFAHAMQLTARSTMTDVLMTALVAHTHVCQRADIFWKRTEDTVGCFELLLPLGVGPEVERGKGEKTTITLFACLHPAAETVDAA